MAQNVVDVAIDPTTLQELRQRLVQYGRPHIWKSIWQVINTFVPYAALWVIIVYMVRNGFAVWQIAPLILLASLFLVRIFVLFHDCVHGSFFQSQRLNSLMGYLSGTLVFTSYGSWAHSHNIHHGTYANLDHRGVGDIWTLTRDEYLSLPRLTRLAYRLYRSPLVMTGLGPPVMFLFVFRFPEKGDGKKERRGVILSNLLICIMFATMGAVIGWKTYLLLQLAIMAIASNIGVWLFYVQHQFEGVYWSRDADWDQLKAALTGSSHYRLPRVFQWFSCSIGLHHVHHVLPRIPNYNLQTAYDATPLLQTARQLTIMRSLSSLRLNLWDEEHRRLVSFRSLKQSSHSRNDNSPDHNMLPQT
ncbi:MAG: fatty acid desaturase [Verrucomicrobia bacterium]|nr:fatty acid desaturase [Verrucomicrobiota bacterium]